MRRKHLMTALMCALCMAVAPAAAAFAEEEAVVEETAETEEETEEAAETEAAEEETEEAAETEAAEEETEEAEVTEESAEAEETVEEEKLLRPDYVALDYLTLGEYKNLTVTVAPIEVTDEMVDAEADTRISQLDVMETLTEGTVQEGDIANIDYEGKKDGVAFDGGTAAGYDLEIGSGSFIDGFEDGLIGVEIGETVDLELTFPESYPSEELAGQDVVFTVTVHEVQRMPEITDELISTATEGEYEDLASFKENIRTELEEEQELERENTILSELLVQIADNSEVSEYPEELKEYATQDTVGYYEQMASMYGMEFADFISAYFGMTEEAFNEQVAAAVETSLKNEMCLKAIAETEGIEVTEEEYQEGCETFSVIYGYEEIDPFLESVGGENVVRISLLIEEVYAFLLENVVLEETAE